MTDAVIVAKEHAEIQFVFENTRPVDVTDLGRSLQALGREYEEFVISRGFEPPPVNARLFVTRVEGGSIIVTLETLLEQASFLVKNIQVLAGFITNLNEIINYLLHFDKPVKPDVNGASIERISTIVEPVAKDGGSNLTLNLNVSGNTGPVNVQPIIITSERANAVQNGARRFLSASIPSDGRFTRQRLKLYQAKADPRAKTGDRGIIEKFSGRPVKLRFMTPAVKSAIVEQHSNPFTATWIWVMGCIL